MTVSSIRVRSSKNRPKDGKLYMLEDKLDENLRGRKTY
mgnify:CR=1 FL=1